MRRRGTVRAWWWAVGWLSCLAASASAVAQGTSDGVFDGTGPSSEGGLRPGTTPFLLLQILAVILLWGTAFALAFFVWFPRRLEGGGPRRPRPREAYGTAWSWVLASWSLAILLVFWKDLVLERIFGVDVNAIPGGGVVNHWSPKIALILVAVVAYVWVTSHYRAPTRSAGGAAP